MNKKYLIGGLLAAMAISSGAFALAAKAASSSSATGKLIEIYMSANLTALVVMPDGTYAGGSAGNANTVNTVVLTANNLCDLTKPITSGGADVLYCIAK